MNAIAKQVGTLTILVVDERREHSREWSRELELAGGSLFVACSALEMRALLAQRPVDIAVINGTSLTPGVVEVLDWRATNEDRPKVIFVTADFTGRKVLRLAQAADLVLPGPLEPGLLLNAVTMLAGRRDEVLRFADAYKLSPRETALIRHALAGASSEEAATALGCTRGTVATFWNRIFRKTGVSSQRNVIILFMRVARGSGTQRANKGTSSEDT